MASSGPQTTNIHASIPDEKLQPETGARTTEETDTSVQAPVQHADQTHPVTGQQIDEEKDSNRVTIANGSAQDSAALPSGASQDDSDVEKQDEKPHGEDKDNKDGLINGRTKGKIAVIMVALCLALFLAALDVTIVTVALPTISDHFHSAAGYTWIGSAFLLANAASIPSWGKISDIFGRKPMLLIANVIFMVGSLVAALSNSIGMLIAARAVQGLGGGGLIILVNIVIGDLFPLRIRGAFYGIVGAVWAISSSIGPIVGGAFTTGVSWRWCFYINLPLDGIAFFILLFFLDIKTPRTPLWDGIKAIDWVGTLLIVGGTLMFLFGLQYGGQEAPWDSAEVLCLIIIGVFTLVLFFLWEWKFAKYPIMPLAIFSSVTNAATLACVFLHGYVFISSSYYLPLYFQAIRGANPILSGVYVLPTAVAVSIGSLTTGFFVAKTGWFLPPIYFAFTFMTLGWGLFTDFTATSGWAKLICFQIIAGLGVGPMFQAPLIALQAHINPRDIGTGTATLGFVRQLATTISVVIGEVVYSNQLNKKSASLRSELTQGQASHILNGNIGANTQFIDQLPQPQKSDVRVAFADSLQPMWIMYCCFAALGFIVMFFIKRKVLTREHTETKTGLDAEKQNAEARQAEKDMKRETKRQSKLTAASKNDVREPSRPVSNAISEEDTDKDIEAARPPVPSSENVAKDIST